MSFDKVLVANRGEIAARILRTCRSMGLATVAVYSDADRDARFVREADEAVHIGPAPSRDSYLAVDRILAAAARTGADAIHPGYGFLSENADFAEACEAAGLVFIGPTADAIRLMGSKIASKRAVAEHRVPVIPGCTCGDRDGDDPELVAQAEEIGYPLLVKASAGGGGKGMRVVREPSGLAAAIESARREAQSAFGDGDLLLERYVDGPRHIEVQVLGDGRGEVIHCFERECSVQRRHQKILEETPSPALDDALRDAITAAAVRAASAIAYRSAGTVEMILGADGGFYFLEMNTRLQVEHPVTELVTGLDLVRLQLEIARTGALPLGQADVVRRGHAIEARLYAEDPAQGFLPQTGTLLDWHIEAADGLRVDSGVGPGDAVGIHYDPMLAKVIAWGADRAEATRRLRRALSTASIQGVTTNRRFLVAALSHPAWVSGALTTHFVPDHFPDWTTPAPTDDDLAAAALAVTLDGVATRAASRAILPGVGVGWRNNRYRDARAIWDRADGGAALVVSYRADGEGRFRCVVAPEDAGNAGAERIVRVAERSAEGAVTRVALEVDGHRRVLRVARAGAKAWVHVGGVDVALALRPEFPDQDAAAGAEGCRAPMPGKVLRVLAEAGAEVTRGQPLVILEAMKMEHTIGAPHDGTLEAVLVAVGDVVEAEQPLARVAARAEA